MTWYQMLLSVFILLLLCVCPLAGQYSLCLTPHFNCVTTKVYGQYSDHVSHVTQSTERVYYDEGRQMVRLEETGQTDGQPFWQLRIFDYPKKILYSVTSPGGQEKCLKMTLTKRFNKICLPNNTQEIWLKSTLGSEGNMVPTNRFKWETGNITTELTYTYTDTPVLQSKYGTRSDGALNAIQVFETSWFTNITSSDPGASVFLPPKSCNTIVVKETPNLYKHEDNYFIY